MAYGDAAPQRSRLFTVRIWEEPSGDGIEHRGSVRNAVSGAHRGFRQWSELTAFLTDELDEDRVREGDHDGD